MSKPLDEEIESRIRKSHNERFVEAIESIERRTAKIEGAVENLARSGAQAAAAADLAADRLTRRSILMPVLGAMIVFALLPIFILVFFWIGGVGLMLFGKGAESVSDQLRASPPRPAQTAPAEPPPRPAKATPGMTLLNFNAIKSGMDYIAVQTLLGVHGEEESRDDAGGTRTVVMRWNLSSPSGAYIVVTFKNGQVSDKRQVGLK